MEKNGTSKPKSFTDLSTGQIRKILNEEAKSNKAIDKEIKTHAQELRRQINLLLLGALAPPWTGPLLFLTHTILRFDLRWNHFIICSHFRTGAGEAGKSTFLKQLRVLHSTGFGEQERRTYVRIVRRNILAGLKEIIKHALAENLPFPGELSVRRNCPALLLL